MLLNRGSGKIMRNFLEIGSHVHGGDALNSQTAIINPAEKMESVSVIDFAGIFVTDLVGKEQVMNL